MLAKLVVLVGLPRSGKTTVVKSFYKGNGYAVVCPDLVRRAIHGERFNERAEPFVWATVYAMVDALLLAECLVVVDATNITEKRRAPWRVRGAVFDFIDTPAEECIRRAREAGDEEIVPAIERQARELEPLLAGDVQGCRPPLERRNDNASRRLTEPVA